MTYLKGWNVEDLEGCFKKEEPTVARNNWSIRLSELTLPYNGETTTEYLIKAADNYACKYGAMPHTLLIPQNVYVHLMNEIGSLRQYTRALRNPMSDTLQLYCVYGMIEIARDPKL